MSQFMTQKRVNIAIALSALWKKSLLAKCIK